MWDEVANRLGSTVSLLIGIGVFLQHTCEFGEYFNRVLVGVRSGSLSSIMHINSVTRAQIRVAEHHRTHLESWRLTPLQSLFPLRIWSQNSRENTRVSRDQTSLILSRFDQQP